METHLIATSVAFQNGGITWRQDGAGGPFHYIPVGG